MIKITDKAKCSGCHACYSACPKKCIIMKRDEEGFEYPSLDMSLCIDCGMCEKVCPIISQEKPDANKIPTAFAAINTNDDIRLKSSSGGVFTLLAEAVIRKKGVVFGAAFNDSFEVEHTVIEKTEDIEKLRGSKYVQSKIGGSYRLAKELLNNGRLVLFTGTPCQIGGLKAYLNRDYENLICQDIICHGVPSPAVWERYKIHRADHDKADVQSISFRDKRYGWKSYSISFKYKDNEYSGKRHEDPYIQAFLKNLCLRPSCYDCNFKTLSRHADITLADFWGVQKIVPEMYDSKGTSLVLIHSEKGKSLWDDIKESLIFKEAPVLIATKRNGASLNSVSQYRHRKQFMKQIMVRPFDKVAKKHLFINRIESKLLRIKNKLLKRSR